MRLISNDESVARGEVSILAIIETLLAIALVFYLSTHFNTLRWLAIAMCVSPLLLLRTEESTRLGIKWFDWWRSQVVIRAAGDDGPGIQMVARTAVAIILTILGPPIIRTCATVACFVTQPGNSLKRIPENWVRVILATDSRHAPEMIPEHDRWNVEWIRRIWEEGGWTGVAGVPLVFCFLFLPALLYRWSLKATSIIYAPLVFVAHSTFSESADLRTKLELIKRGDLSRLRVWYGVIAIIAFIVKLVLLMNLPGFVDWWNMHPVSRFLALYVAPAEIPKWQLAELANSVLAIGAMLFARRALLGYELQHPWPEAPVQRVLGVVSGLRWVLALYAIACTAYITMRAAQHWHWPALGEQWLPWG